MRAANYHLLEKLLELAETRTELTGSDLDELKARFLLIASSSPDTLKRVDALTYRVVLEDSKRPALGERSGLVVPGCELTLSQFARTLRTLSEAALEDASFAYDEFLSGLRAIECVVSAFEWSSTEAQQPVVLARDELRKPTEEALGSLMHFRANGAALPIGPIRAARRHLIERLIQLCEQPTTLVGSSLDELKAQLLLASPGTTDAARDIEGVSYQRLLRNEDQPEEGELSGLALPNAQLVLEDFVNELCWDLPTLSLEGMPFSRQEFQTGLLATLVIVLALDWSSFDADYPSRYEPEKLSSMLAALVRSLESYRRTGEP